MMDDPTVFSSNLDSGEQRRLSNIRSTSQALGETPEKSSRSTPVTSVRDTPQAEKQSVKDESPVPSRSLRRRKSAVSNGVVSDPVGEAIKPLTEEERQNWKGWVELESDPVSILPSINEFFCTTVAFQD
jgi:ubiquitin carboxyl-terminal hydrolase L5